MTTLVTIPDSTGTVAQINENFKSVGAAGLYGYNGFTTSGLNFGYYGGRAFSNTIPDGTVTLTASTTNYIVADRSTGVVSSATNTTNWNDTADYLKLYSVVTGTSTITSMVDERQAYGGVSSGGGVISVNAQTGVVVLDTDDVAEGTTNLFLTPERIDDRVAALLVAGTNVTLTYNDVANTLTVAASGGGGGMTNPMTTAGDVIVGGTSGTPQRVGAGANGDVLTVVSGAPAWAAPAGGGFTGGALTSALNEAKGTDIARAATTDIGAATGNFVHLTGTTTITGLGAVQAGTRRVVRFAGAGTLTHNATSLILPGAANITTAANDCAIFVSEGSGNWRCVAYSRANGTAIAASASASLTNFTGSLNTVSPNNTINAARLLVTGGTTDVDFVAQPKGAGAFQLQLADNTGTGGNKRGSYAVDLQMTRGLNAQVASGTWSFIAGSDNTGSGSFSVALGSNNTASGAAAFAAGSGNSATGSPSMAIGVGNAAGGVSSGAFGNGNTASADKCFSFGSNSTSSAEGGFTFGQSCVADGFYSSARGMEANARGVRGMQAYASGAFSVSGDAQAAYMVLRTSTPGSTVTPATSDNFAAAATNQIPVPTDSAVAFSALVVARRASNGDSARWVVSGLAKNVGGTVSIVGSVTSTKDVSDAGASAWLLAAVADNTNKSVTFNVTGVAAVAIKWVVDARLVTVIG